MGVVFKVTRDSSSLVSIFWELLSKVVLVVNCNITAINPGYHSQEHLRAGKLFQALC